MNSYKEVDQDGTVRWYLNGTKIYHREDGPSVEFADGHKTWYQNGKHHRTDGPAIESSNGDKYWYRDGQCHRLDGPAIECANGDKVWFYEGKCIECSTQEEFERLIKFKAFW